MIVKEIDLNNFCTPHASYNLPPTIKQIGDYTVSTNGYLFIAIKNTPETELPDCDWSASKTKAVEGFINKAEILPYEGVFKPIEESLKECPECLGKGVYLKKCSNCRGTGECSCSDCGYGHSCDTCSGTGEEDNSLSDSTCEECKGEKFVPEYKDVIINHTIYKGFYIKKILTLPHVLYCTTNIESPRGLLFFSFEHGYGGVMHTV